MQNGLNSLPCNWPLGQPNGLGDGLGLGILGTGTMG